jgi:hypothetical protein
LGFTRLEPIGSETVQTTQDTPQEKSPKTASTEAASSAQTTTLEKFGDQFPVGYDGKPRAFAFRKWRMKEERELGALRDQNRNSSMPEYVSIILGTMATKWGEHDFEALKMPERRVILSQAWMADIFYAYACLRIHALGPHLAMQITCAHCAHEFSFKADLKTVEVNTVGKLADALWKYKLEEPFEMRGKKIESLVLGPQRWSTVESMDVAGQLDIGGFKAGVIIGSVHEVDGLGAVPLGPTEFDEMTKIDIEGLTTALDEHRVGPDMSIKGECAKCKREFSRSLDWGYDDFFAGSSR